VLEIQSYNPKSNFDLGWLGRGNMYYYYGQRVMPEVEFLILSAKETRDRENNKQQYLVEAHILPDSTTWMIS